MKKGQKRHLPTIEWQCRVCNKYNPKGKRFCKHDQLGNKYDRKTQKIISLKKTKEARV